MLPRSLGLKRPDRRVSGHAVDTAKLTQMTLSVISRPPIDALRKVHLVGTNNEKLIDPLPRKAISSVPKLANWTPFAFVVDSFLVRAADYGVGHRDRQHSMLFDKFQYLPGNTGIVTNVTTINLPVAQLSYVCILGWNDADGDLRR